MKISSQYPQFNYCDETYFLYSEKGNKQLSRESRKRAITTNRDGINDEQVAVIVTLERQDNNAMLLIKRVRITTKDIQKELQAKISSDSIFCSDGHEGFPRSTIKLNVKQITWKDEKIKIYRDTNC